MDALVMCGGKGTRLESPHEKPLHPVAGAPMIDRVLAGLEESCVKTVFAAVSPNAPETGDHLERRDAVRTIETAGEGYVTDLLDVLDHPAIEPPILTVAADLPLLAGAEIDSVLRDYGGTASVTVCVPARLKQRLGVSVETRLESDPHLAPTGVNIVGNSEESMTTISYDPRLAVNVNRLEDVRTAEERCE